MPPDKVRLAYALAVSYAGMVCLAIAVNLTPVLATTLSARFGRETPASSQPEPGAQEQGGSVRRLTNEQLGRISAAIFIGLVVAILATGPLADRFGARLFPVAGSLLVGAGLAILGLAPSYAVVLAAAFVMGAGAGVLDMVLSPIVSALQPERRTTAMNWLHGFYSIGAVATTLIGSLAPERGPGWRAVALGLIALPALVSVGFLGMRVPRLVAEGQERTRLRVLARKPYFLAALAGIFFVGGTELAMAQWLPAYAERGLRYSKRAGDTAFVAFYVAMAIGRMGSGAVGHRASAIRLMLSGCGLAVLCYVTASLAPWRPAALGACIVLGFACSCLWPSLLALVANRFPRGGASMFAILAAFGNSGGIVLPWAVGATADLAGLRLGIATATLCPLLLAGILLWMRGRPNDE